MLMVAAKEYEGQQHEVGDCDLAHQDTAPASRIHGLQHREEQRDVPDRVHDQEQGDDGRDNVHLRIISAGHGRPGAVVRNRRTR